MNTPEDDEQRSIEIRTAADRALWIDLALLFTGNYDNREWVPLLWMLPYVLIGLYDKYQVAKSQ